MSKPRETQRDLIVPETERAPVAAGGPGDMLQASDRSGPVERLGRRMREGIAGIFYFLGYLAQVLKETPRFFKKRQAAYKVLVMQILFTGVEALSIVSLLAIGLGAVIIIQGYAIYPQLLQFSQGRLMYDLLVIIITRELGPVLTAFIIIARSGTAIATELGNMVVSHEIEAYMAFGINPISYLVVPRVLGVMIATTVLTVYFSLFGLLGSFFIATFAADLPFQEYLRNLVQTLTAGDIIISIIKAAAFGAVIAIISTFEGFKVNRATTEIPQAGIKAVGKCFGWTIITNALITVVYYILRSVA